MTAKQKIDKILEIIDLGFNDFAIECKLIPNSLKAAIRREALTDDIVTKIHDRFGVRKGFFKDGKDPVIEKNITSVQNRSDNTEIPAGVKLDERSKELYSVASKESYYAFLPKTILEGEYRIELKSEIQDRRHMQNVALDAYKKLVKKLEDEIADLRSGKIPIITTAPETTK